MTRSPRSARDDESKIFISCGELSGEQHAARVVKELDTSKHKVFALGSKLLAQEGVELLEDYRDYSFNGLTEVLFNLPKILSLKNKLIEKLKEIKPDLVLLVDYSGFNLELAKSIKACPELSQVKIYEYIAPQLWASRPYRIKKVKAYVDKVLCTLPFEEKLYQEAGVPVKYVGNPVLESLSVTPNSAQNDSRILVGLFPGSRKTEISYMLPEMLKAAKRLEAKFPEKQFEFKISRAPSISKEFLQERLDRHAPLAFTVWDPDDIENANHKLLSSADFLWLCSGTVTLEAALYTTPYFLAYKSNLINYAVYLMIRCIKLAGLANIIAGKMLVKEFLQYDASAENFVEESSAWLTEKGFSDYYYKIKKDLEDFKASLSGFETAKLVAKEISNEII